MVKVGKGGGCCKDRTKSRKTWCIFTFISAAALCGAAAYLYISVQGLVVPLACAFTNMQALSSAAATSEGAEIAAQFPTQMIDILANMSPYLDFASMGPAIISAVLLLICGLLAFGLCGEKSFCCAKFFMWLTQFILLITFAWYVVVAAAGLLSDRPVFTDQWQQLTSVCTDNLPTMQQAVTDANTALDNARANGATPGQIAGDEAQLASATVQLGQFETLCTCLDQVPARLKDVPGAGLAGLGGTLFAFFCLNGLCCAAGCCKKPKTGARIAPVQEAALSAKRDPNEEGDDELYEQDVNDADLIRN